LASKASAIRFAPQSASGSQIAAPVSWKYS